MGVSFPGTLVRSGEERATLVRRTYGLVFISVIVTAHRRRVRVHAARAHGGRRAASDHHDAGDVRAAVDGDAGAAQLPEEHDPHPPLHLHRGDLDLAVPVHGGARQPGIVGQAGLLTLSTFGVLSLYAVMSKRDFSAWGSFFIVGLWVLIATSLINMFVGSALGSLWIAGGTVLVFSGLLVFDTWRIVRSGVYGPDDYVPAAVNIYLDLLNLFLAIISLLGGGRRRS